MPHPSSILSILIWNSDVWTTQNLLQLVFLFFQEEAFSPSNFLPKVHDQDITFCRKSGLPIFFPQQKSSCCVLSSQENKSLYSHCRSNLLFQQSLHLLLRYTIRTKYTQKFCFFHTYGDVYAPLNTFMGTWISSKFIIFISNSDSDSTKSKYRQNIYSAFICIKFRRISISLIKLIGRGMFSSIVLSLFWRMIDL